VRFGGRDAAIASGALLLAGLVIACGGGGPDAPAEYVGAAECAACHAEATTAWFGSDHDRAMEVADPATVLPPAGSGLRFAGGETRLERDGEGYRLVTPGPDGEPATYPVPYVFGVDPLQQFLVPLPGGALHAHTAAWDSRPDSVGGGTWFHLQPDSDGTWDDPLHWTRRFYNWNRQCAECHSTDVRRNFDRETLTYATTWEEIDVACEACHGPGSLHVAWARDGADPGRPDGLVTDLADTWQWLREPGDSVAVRQPAVPASEQLAVCAPCHSRRAPLTEGYRPGEPFADTHHLSLLEEGLYHVDGSLLDEVYVFGSFLQSRMHRAGVVCSDCHEPHSLSLKADGNTLCGRCHDPAVFDAPAHHFHKPDTEGAACVSCHMPATVYMEVDPRRDHSFRIPRPDLAALLGFPEPCTGCHADRTPDWAANEIRARSGPDALDRPSFAAALEAAREGRPGAGDALARLALDPEQPGIARATALSLLDASVPGAREAWRAGTRDPDPLVRRGALEGLQQAPFPERLALAPPLLDDPRRDVRMEAASTLNPVPRPALSPDQRRRLDTALGAHDSLLALHGDRGELHTGAGFRHAERGELEEAEAAYREAIRVDPDYVPAAVNLADLLGRQGREDEAEAVLREALVRTPIQADLHHALGLSLVRQRRYEEAEMELREAARLAPRRARYVFVHAVALEALGRLDEARAVLDTALAERPWLEDLAALRDRLGIR
jgi:predicted CXXCH cytochrome family protein